MPDEAICCTNCGAPLQAGQAPPPPYDQQQDFQQAGYQPSYQQTGYQQPPYQQQGYQPYAQQQMYAGSASNGMAIASLILGIVSILTSSLFIGFVLGIIGVVLGVKARNEIPEGAPGRNFATGGLVCSVIGAVLGGIVLLSCVCIGGIGGCAAIMENLCILGGLL